MRKLSLVWWEHHGVGSWSKHYDHPTLGRIVVSEHWKEPTVYRIEFASRPKATRRKQKRGTKQKACA